MNGARSAIAPLSTASATQSVLIKAMSHAPFFNPACVNSVSYNGFRSIDLYASRNGQPVAAWKLAYCF